MAKRQKKGGEQQASVGLEAPPPRAVGKRIFDVKVGYVWTGQRFEFCLVIWRWVRKEPRIYIITDQARLITAEEVRSTQWLDIPPSRVIERWQRGANTRVRALFQEVIEDGFAGDTIQSAASYRPRFPVVARH